MKKMISKAVIKSLLLGVILAVLLLIAGNILIYKSGTEKYKNFYSEEEQFDVLFFGSSRVLDAFQPMELWDEYGIRSYNMAQHSESLGRDYWQLKNALKHQVPRLVVMDISAYFGLYTVDPYDRDQMGGLHKQIDHIPFSLTKLETINELVPKGNRAEFIFPFILYHSRWNEVTSADFHYYKYKNLRKGSESRAFYQYLQKPVWDDSVVEETFPFEDTKIEEITALCREYGTDVLFINVPYCFETDNQGMLNYIGNYFEQNNIQYINYQRDAEFIDYALDMADPAHLNTAGSIKLTNAFGQYFVETYGRSECSSKTENEWNEILDKYRAEKKSIIEISDNYRELLMLCYADNDYEVKVIASPERLDYTETNMFFPDMEGTDGYEGYRIEIYLQGENEPFKVWEDK